ncbi:M20/M25/M40 family metallo-hydrolase [Salinimicrobium catena]|uniref:M20/M25/M40 family metallo-hydrolase n=1 Tax=Salinimicrobium catena TaxID=390640 RepID=UPI002FE47F3C
MSKKIQALLSFLILVAAIFWSFYGTGPHVELQQDIPAEEFSVKRAFSHVEALAQEPHYVGSAAHRKVRNYIVSELEKMGLLVQTQEAYSLNKKGLLTRPQNILARIEGSGNGKALLLLTHYDSAMHSSFGASDAGSGIATILEGVRAFLASGKTPKNDIILLFSDAEELGLNGADIFVEEHPWAKDVGLVLNFESRGSGGDSLMFLETNDGNRRLLEEFLEAGVEYPVGNSLVYSIYKMMPNDTDLTVMREQGNINGFNFAFIDDHFDYHTATDLPVNLDINSLAHQGEYLMPLLNYFSHNSLEDMSSEEDMIFFNLPVLDLVMYPFSWIWPMLLLAAVGFLAVIGFGFYKKHLQISAVFKGSLPLLLSLVLGGLLSYGLWELALYLYPQYLEMEHGFTYNGYFYIAAAAFLSLAVALYIYNAFRKPGNEAALFVAPLFFWLLLSLLVAVFLQGAAYFIVPVFFGIIQLFLMLKKPRLELPVQALLSLPAIFLFTDFTVRFPVALGLKIIFVTAILTVLLWVLLWPVFSRYSKLQLLGFLSFLTFLVFFMVAHFTADFSAERPRPNSLVYVYDKERDVATWNSYDHQLDEWNAPYFENASEVVSEKPEFSSKYGSAFRHTAVAPKVEVPAPFISVEKKASINPEEDAYSVKIAPNRQINRLELYLDRNFDFRSFTANGNEAPKLQPEFSELHVFKNRWNDRLLEYYPVSRDTLRLVMAVEKGIHPTIQLYESAYDLFDHPQLDVEPRGPEMIPRPFVLNDAVILKSSFKLE